MAKCKTCKIKLNKTWDYCPKCGRKLRDKSVFPVAKTSYMWEKEEGGAFVYKNFRAIKESGVIPLRETRAIRPTLGDLCHINFCNLRKFSFLSYNPHLIYELYEACKLMGYYDAENFVRKSGLEKLRQSLIRTDYFWSIYENKKFVVTSKSLFKKFGVGILEWSIDKQNGRVSYIIKESISTPVKSSHPCCSDQIGDFIGALETLSYRFWSGTESKCTAKGDDYCQFDMYITETEEKPHIDLLDKAEVERILDEIIHSLNKDVVYRKTIGDYAHISGDQCINYVLTSNRGHEMLAKWSGGIVGRKIAQRYELKGEDESLEYLRNIFLRLKVGILDRPQKMTDAIKIKMHESVYSSGVNNVNKKLDIFIAGIIEGALKQATDKKWQVEEAICMASGGEYCEFIAKVR